MENLDVMVLRHLRDWRSAGQRALLATVVRTWGSSPRPVGSIMALSEDGAVVGSVSGGCIEDDLIFRFTRAYAAGAVNAPSAPGVDGNIASPPDASADANGDEDSKSIPSGPPRFVKYGISADEAHRFGLPCGGTLELLLEFDPDAQQLAELVESLEDGAAHAARGASARRRRAAASEPPSRRRCACPMRNWSTRSAPSTACC